jgi:hypothetical protein
VNDVGNADVHDRGSLPGTSGYNDRNPTKPFLRRSIAAAATALSFGRVRLFT